MKAIIIITIILAALILVLLVLWLLVCMVISGMASKEEIDVEHHTE